MNYQWTLAHDFYPFVLFFSIHHPQLKIEVEDPGRVKTNIKDWVLLKHGSFMPLATPLTAPGGKSSNPDIVNA
jgi:hypothetical protein